MLIKIKHFYSISKIFMELEMYFKPQFQILEILRPVVPSTHPNIVHKTRRKETH